MMRFALPLIALLALPACGPSDTDPGPGGVTVGEARALDEAAEMLEQRRLPPEVLETGGNTAQAPPEAGNASPVGE